MKKYIFCRVMTDSEEVSVKIVANFHYPQWLNCFANFRKYLYLEYSKCKDYKEPYAIESLTESVYQINTLIMLELYVYY